MNVTSSSTIRLNGDLAVSYTQNVRRQLDQFAHEAKNGRSNWRVVCHDTHGFVASCQFHWLQWVWHIFVEIFDFLDPSYLEDNERTMAYFTKVFGRKRIERWDEKYTLYYSYKREERLEITKAYVKKIFSAVSCVTKTDVQEILEAIQQRIIIHPSTNVVEPILDLTDLDPFLYLTREQSVELVRYFHRRIALAATQPGGAKKLTVEDLTLDELDFLYDILKPFSFEAASLYSGENRETGNDRGYTIDGLLRLSGKIDEIRDLYRVPPSIDSPSVAAMDERMQEIKTEVSIGKKIVGCYNPEGTMIRTKEGWFYVEHKLNSAGMYMVYLRAVNRMNADRLYFLHTQSFGFIPWKWQPLREIFSRDSGQKSIRNGRDLRNVVAPRAVDPSYQLKMFGYSLGAAGVIRQAGDFLARHERSFISEVMTFSGLGIDRDTATWIDRELEERGAQGHQKPKITYIRNFGDRVSDMGETNPMPDELIYLCDGEEELDRCRIDPKLIRESHYNSWHLAFEIYRSINVPHCQEVSAHTRMYALSAARNGDRIRALIDNTNPNFEEQRQWAAQWFSSKQRFSHYLAEEKAKRVAHAAHHIAFSPSSTGLLPLSLSAAS